MSSEVDICNLALARLGDAATVSSIDPPEGSAQAEHCATFYPIARDALLEMHPWGFATKRVTLALLSSAWPEWTYCYAQPSNVVNLLAVMPPLAKNDYDINLAIPDANGLVSPDLPMQFRTMGYQPQDYSAETLDDGTEVIYTNQANAALRYTTLVTDTTKFSPLFVTTLTCLLASYLAGPVIKGDAGRKAAAQWATEAKAWLSKATVSDANQRQATVTVSTPWVAAR